MLRRSCCGISNGEVLGLLEKGLGCSWSSQHAVNTAAALFRRSDRRRRSSGRPFVCDDLLEALDTVLGEGRDAILADAVDAQAAVFGEHVDREFCSQSTSSPSISATYVMVKTLVMADKVR